MTCHCFLRPIRRDLTSSSYTTWLSLGGGENPPFLLKSGQFLFEPARLQTMALGRDEKTRWRGKRKVLTRNCKEEYVETRCLRNERFLSSDEYCVKETNEEKRKQRNIMARFIESWGLWGSVSSFSLHLPLHSSFFALSLQLSLNNSIGNTLLAFVLYSHGLLRSLFGSLYVSGKLPTYPSPKPTSTLTSHLKIESCFILNVYIF